MTESVVTPIPYGFISALTCHLSVQERSNQSSGHIIYVQTDDFLFW